MKKSIDNLAKLFGLQRHHWLIDAPDVLEEMPVALIAIGDDDVIQFANRRACKTFGYRREDLIGGSIESLLSINPDRESAPEHPGTVTVKAEDQGRRQDGTLFPAVLHFKKLASTSSPLTLIAIEDMTKERELERMKHEFLAMISHDLRSPLAAILGNVSLLTQGVFGTLPDQAQNSLRVIDQILCRLSKLVNDLLMIEKLSSGTFQVDVKPVSPDEFLESALSSVGAEADRKNITFKFETAELKDRRVLADADRVVQVLVNLMSNAVKFSPSDSAVIIRGTLQQQFALFAVIDEGPGVPLDQQNLIFEKFKQAAAVDDTKSGGIGLGLAICKSIIEDHGGSIGVICGSGKGSRFWFTLPLVTT